MVIFHSNVKYPGGNSNNRGLFHLVTCLEAKKGAIGVLSVPVSISGGLFGAMNRVSQPHAHMNGLHRSCGVITPLCLVGNRDAIPVCL